MKQRKISLLSEREEGGKGREGGGGEYGRGERETINKLFFKKSTQNKVWSKYETQ